MKKCVFSPSHMMRKMCVFLTGCTVHKKTAEYSNHWEFPTCHGLSYPILPTILEEIFQCFHLSALRLDRGGRNLSSELL